MRLPVQLIPIPEDPLGPRLCLPALLSPDITELGRLLFVRPIFTALGIQRGLLAQPAGAQGGCLEAHLRAPASVLMDQHLSLRPV